MWGPASAMWTNVIENIGRVATSMFARAGCMRTDRRIDIRVFARLLDTMCKFCGRV